MDCIEKKTDNKKALKSFDELIMEIIHEYERNSLFPDVICFPFNWESLMLLGDWLKPNGSIMKSNGEDRIVVGMQWGICFMVEKGLSSETFTVEFEKKGKREIEMRKLNEFLGKEENAFKE
ncbi:hypothetical protein KAX97_10740 [candidate division WOR-3 bacterium]|nr:hypothetical protein [candidate division WOR-3 bacterium]